MCLPVPLPLPTQTRVVTHELGHNLGLGHPMMVTPGGSEEYDWADVMGAGGWFSSGLYTSFCYNAPHSLQLGWAELLQDPITALDFASEDPSNVIG